ncbi:sigma factor [Streptomyces tubercidicus]|uniref:sigma factor n=1 Tax=Streptomyces tubercidicus TaxID=47759 RepID=UPI00346707DF
MAAVAQSGGTNPQVFLQRLDALEEGVREHQCVRNTLIEMNLTSVHSVARRSSGRRDSAEEILQAGTAGLIKAIDRWPPPDCTAPQLLRAACRLSPYKPAWARGSASDGPP